MPQPAPPIYLIELLVTNGCVVTMDAFGTVFESGAVAIDQGRIIWVGPSSEAVAIPAQEVLDAHGAIITGSIEAGKAADLIVVEGATLDTLPALDPIFILARCATGRDVRSVVVDGRVVVKDGRLLTVDEAALGAEVQERSAAIMARFEATL